MEDQANVTVGEELAPAPAPAPATQSDKQLVRARMAELAAIENDGQGVSTVVAKVARLSSGRGTWREMFWWAVSLAWTLVAASQLWARLGATITVFVLSFITGNVVGMATAAFSFAGIVYEAVPVLFTLPLTLAFGIVAFASRTVKYVIAGYARTMWVMVVRPFLLIAIAPPVCYYVGGKVIFQASMAGPLASTVVRTVPGNMGGYVMLFAHGYLPAMICNEMCLDKIGLATERFLIGGVVCTFSAWLFARGTSAAARLLAAAGRTAWRRCARRLGW